MKLLKSFLYSTALVSCLSYAQTKDSFGVPYAGNSLQNYAIGSYASAGVEGGIASFRVLATYDVGDEPKKTE